MKYVFLLIFQEDILSPYTYIDSLSGKKVRSKLIAALNYWFRVPQEKILIIDEVIGMLHNASLLIDDIEDGSELRRGARAAHTIYGVPLTINAAELTCFIAIQKAMELGHPHVPRVMIGKKTYFSYILLSSKRQFFKYSFLYDEK